MVIFNYLLVQAVLPFLLIFVLIFAVLQKSKIFGEGKHQIDSLVSLVIALIVVAVPGPQKFIIVNMMPWLAVGLAVLLVFFILYGFVAGDLSDLPTWMKAAFGVLALVFTSAIVVALTNVDRILLSWFEGTGDFFVNGIILVLVVAGIVWVVLSTKSGS
jgi:hypothetical protein